jgi:TP901-1 family phage major tail protein
MAKAKGRDFLVKVGNGGSPTETFTTVAGMRSTSMTLNNEIVDVTDKDGDAWRKVLAGAGIQSMSIKLSGVMSDAASAMDMQAKAFANTIHNYELVSGLGDTFAGAFQITSFERGGEYNKEETYSLTLESAGTITYTP